MEPSSKPQSHGQYFALAAPGVRAELVRIRASVQAALPAAQPCISYGMPAFRLGKVFFYFAAFKRHIGVYPPVKGSAALQARLAPYRGPKGNLIFPLAQPVPHALIQEVALALASEYGVAQAKPGPQCAG